MDQQRVAAITLETKPELGSPLTLFRCSAHNDTLIHFETTSSAILKIITDSICVKIA